VSIAKWSFVLTDLYQFINNKSNGFYVVVRRVWRYQWGNQNPYIEEEHTDGPPLIHLSVFYLRTSEWWHAISVLNFLFKHALLNIHMQSNIEDGWKTFNEIISHQSYNKRDKGTNNDLQNIETSSNTSPSKNCVDNLMCSGRFCYSSDTRRVIVNRQCINWYGNSDGRQYAQINTTVMGTFQTTCR
jgi:hypothetical protein